MTKDLTSGSPLKVILMFTFPLVLGNLFQQFYALADTIIVGRFCGDRLGQLSDSGLCHRRMQRLCHPHCAAVRCAGL